MKRSGDFYSREFIGGRTACPSVVIMDGQSVKTTERGGIRGFDAHKRVKGRKRHILVDTFGLLIACRVEPAAISDRRAAALLLGGLGALFPNIRTVIADAGHQSRKLARHLLQQDGWKLQIVKRRQRAFKITGLTWIVERSFACGREAGGTRARHRRLEYRHLQAESLTESRRSTSCTWETRRPLFSHCIRQLSFFTGGHIRAFLQLFLLTFNSSHNALLSAVPRIIGLKSSPLRCLRFTV